MLSRERLVDLYRELQDEWALSVYLEADEHDPAERNKWRVRFDQQVAQVRKELEGAPDEERRDFEKALERVEERLTSFDAFLPSRGWIAFATPDEVRYSESVPVPVPDLVRWEKGIRAAPYVRGLKQDRPVVTVLLDSQRARVFRYRDGDVEEVQDLRADTYLGDLTDVGVGKRATNRSGVRGETSTDAAQRYLEAGSERLLKDLMRVVLEEAGDTGFVVLGGPPERVSQAARSVPGGMNGRVLEQSSLHLEMTLPEVREAVDRAASVLTNRQQEALLDEVVDQAKAGGRACLGREETERALREMRVDTLLLSRSFIRDDADFADRAVGTAFAQGAAVEELSGDGAARLDSEGGIAARLRFKIRRPEPDTGAPEERSSPEEERRAALKARGEAQPAEAEEETVA